MAPILPPQARSHARRLVAARATDPSSAVLASVVGVATVVLPFVADWNETHLYNSRWSGRAKLHSARAACCTRLGGIHARHPIDYWEEYQD